jgi:hypothetical protein
LSRKHGASYLSPGPTKANKSKSNNSLQEQSKMDHPQNRFYDEETHDPSHHHPMTKDTTKEHKRRSRPPHTHARTHTTSSNLRGTKKTPPKKEPAAAQMRKNKNPKQKKPKNQHKSQTENGRRKRTAHVCA